MNKSIKIVKPASMSMAFFRRLIQNKTNHMTYPLTKERDDSEIEVIVTVAKVKK